MNECLEKENPPVNKNLLSTSSVVFPVASSITNVLLILMGLTHARPVYVYIVLLTAQ
jgi:hypothetical protein